MRIKINIEKVKKCKKVHQQTVRPRLHDTITTDVKPVVQPVVSCKQTSNRLSNRLFNQFENRLCRVNVVLQSRTHGVSIVVNTWLVAWNNDRTSVFSPANFTVLRSTCSRWVTTYVGKPPAIGQPARPTQPFIPPGSINE